MPQIRGSYRGTAAPALAGLVVLALGLAGSLGAGPALAAEVNVYWERGEYWPGTAFEDFARETGVAVRFPVKGASKSEAFEALKAEGAQTRADLFITNDLGNLAKAGGRGLLARIESRALERQVPRDFRDPQGRWFGLALRPRTIVYSTERVKRSDLSTYEALGDGRWRNRLCLRTAASHYNGLFLASWMRRTGEKATEALVGRWLANGPVVLDKDTAVLKAIVAGTCDVGITDTYYLARILASDPKFPVAPFWADQQGAGVHVAVAGGGVTAHARNRASAVKLLEYLTSAAVQNAVVDANYEYPVNAAVSPHPILQRWGPFKAASARLAAAAELEDAAVALAERVGYR